MKIIVTGSLGNISKPLTQELIKKGHNVTVISSKEEKQKEIENLGAKASIGSLIDTHFLTKTFIGADSVYCMIPPNFVAPDQVAYYRSVGNSYAKAIEQSGVKKIVHLSSYGADLEKGTGFIVGSHHVENILNELQGVAVTHLRPGSFYYNLLGFAAMIKAMGFIAANYGGEDKVVMAHPTDIATAAAEEIVLVSTPTKVRYIASDDRTCNETAAILGNAIGKPDLKWTIISDDEMKSALSKKGMPPHVIENLVELYASIHSGLLRANYDLNKPFTMGKVKVEDYAKDFAAAF